MMKKKAWAHVALSLFVAVAISACSQPASVDQPAQQAEQQTPQQSAQQPAQQTAQQPTQQTSGDTAAQPASEQKRPEYLPADFPLPEVAEISTSHSEMKDGKKFVLLIFSTKESMPAVTKLYKDYFKTQNLSDSGQTIDD